MPFLWLAQLQPSSHKLLEDMQSSDLSRYPPPMMQGLAGAISHALSDIGQEASKPTADWTQTPKC